MSSLVERLRVRSDKRPRYTLDESDDDFPPRGGNGKGKDRDGDPPVKQIEREDAVWLITARFRIMSNSNFCADFFEAACG